MHLVFVRRFFIFDFVIFRIKVYYVITIISETQQADNTTPESVAVNFGRRKELQKFPSFGQAVADVIMQFRQIVGNLTVGYMLNMKLLKVSPEFNKMVTFKVNP